MADSEKVVFVVLYSRLLSRSHASQISLEKAYITRVYAGKGWKRNRLSMIVHQYSVSAKNMHPNHAWSCWYHWETAVYQIMVASSFNELRKH